MACKSCKFGMSGGLGEPITCRRNPPLVVMVPQHHPLNPNQVNLAPLSIFPAVGDEWFCGEEKPRDAAVN